MIVGNRSSHLRSPWPTRRQNTGTNEQVRFALANDDARLFRNKHKHTQHTTTTLARPRPDRTKQFKFNDNKQKQIQPLAEALLQFHFSKRDNKDRSNDRRERHADDRDGRLLGNGRFGDFGVIAQIALVGAAVQRVAEAVAPELGRIFEKDVHRAHEIFVVDRARRFANIFAHQGTIKWYRVLTTYETNRNKVKIL